VKANTYLTPIELGSATAIATCRNWTVAAMKKVGAGRVYYIGTNLGGSISTGDPGGIEVLRAIVSSVVRPQTTSSGKLRPRLIQEAGRGLLTVFNDSAEDKTATITVPAGYHRANDIYSGEQHAIRENRFNTMVPFREVAVFDLD
jgi:hypothetical protein